MGDSQVGSDFSFDHSAGFALLQGVRFGVVKEYFGQGKIGC